MLLEVTAEKVGPVAELIGDALISGRSRKAGLAPRRMEANHREVGGASDCFAPVGLVQVAQG